MSIQYFLLLLLTEFIVTSLVAIFTYFFFERKQIKERANLELKLHSHIDKMDNHISLVETHILEILNKK